MVVNFEVFALLYYLQMFIASFVFSQLFSKLSTEASSVHKKTQTNKNKKQTPPPPPPPPFFPLFFFIAIISSKNIWTCSYQITECVSKDETNPERMNTIISHNYYRKK